MQTAAEQNINRRINFGAGADAQLAPAPEGIDYLTAAAALLAKNAATNETVYAQVPQSLRAGRERIARQYALLAAIQRGLLPSELAVTLLDELEG